MRIIALLLVLVSTLAYSESNKPIKYCPKETKPKDYPCIALGPQYYIVARTEIEPVKDSTEVARLRQEITHLKRVIELLELELENKEKPQ